MPIVIMNVASPTTYIIQTRTPVEDHTISHMKHLACTAYDKHVAFRPTVVQVYRMHHPSHSL